MMTNFLSSEVKKWVRDPFLLFMLIYPLFFGVIGRYLIPYLAETNEFALEPIADIVLVALLLFVPAIYGSLAGFSVLDDRDDHIISSVQVTPLNVHTFLAVRMVMATLMTLGACLFLIWYTGLVELARGEAVVISLLIALGAPLTAFLVNSFASNKIEGFAIMKGTGIISIFPLAGLFFYDVKELIFGFAPGFWPAKMLGTLYRGEGVHYLGYQQYLIYGLFYILLASYLTYRLFQKKLEL